MGRALAGQARVGQRARSGAVRVACLFVGGNGAAHYCNQGPRAAPRLDFDFARPALLHRPRERAQRQHPRFTRGSYPRSRRITAPSPGAAQAVKVWSARRRGDRLDAGGAMPPKPAPGAAGGKTSGGAAGGDGEPAARAARAEAEVASLARLLDVRAHEVGGAVARRAGCARDAHSAGRARGWGADPGAGAGSGEGRRRAVRAKEARSRGGPPAHPPAPAHAAQAAQARAAERGWRRRAEAAEVALEQQRADALDVSADMKRQSEARGGAGGRGGQRGGTGTMAAGAAAASAARQNPGAVRGAARPARRAQAPLTVRRRPRHKHATQSATRASSPCRRRCGGSLSSASPRSRQSSGASHGSWRSATRPPRGCAPLRSSRPRQRRCG
jgi:hypothetical protein